MQLERQLAAVTESRSMERNNATTKLVKILADVRPSQRLFGTSQADCRTSAFRS